MDKLVEKFRKFTPYFYENTEIPEYFQTVKKEN